MSNAKKYPIIVKVQVSLSTGAPVQQVLIYNRKRDIEYQGDCDAGILKVMRGELKAFFYARIRKQKIEIGPRAPWKDW